MSEFAIGKGSRRGLYSGECVTRFKIKERREKRGRRGSQWWLLGKKEVGMEVEVAKRSGKVSEFWTKSGRGVITVQPCWPQSHASFTVCRLGRVIVGCLCNIKLLIYQSMDLLFYD